MSRQDSHKIANSRLLALLSKLDTSRGDYGYQRQMRIVRENSRKNMGDSLDNGPCDPAALMTLGGRQSTVPVSDTELSGGSKCIGFGNVHPECDALTNL